MSLEGHKPLGPRVLVDPETPIDQYSARAKDAGLYVVVDDRNKPRPTSGTIVAKGDDPLLVELGLMEGVRVSFGHLAGDKQFINGKEYRLLEVQEIKMKLPSLR